MARFASVGAVEYENILKGMNSANTHRSTNGAWNIFIKYLKEKEINVDPAIIFPPIHPTLNCMIKHLLDSAMADIDLFSLAKIISNSASGLGRILLCSSE